MVCAAALFMLSPAAAQTIYPYDRADILAASRFDFKVEFPGLQKADAVAITVNGARLLSKGIAQGKSLGKLAIDDMPHMALVATAGSDSIITDSANSASAYATGHK